MKLLVLLHLSAGFTIEDSTSTQQIVGGGDTLTVLGTSNEIEAVVSATDTLTIGLPSNAVTVTTKLTTPTVDAGILNTYKWFYYRFKWFNIFW